MVPSLVSRGTPLPRTIVGTVGDAVYVSLRATVQPRLYIPMSQWDFVLLFAGGSINVRSASASPELLMRSVSDALSRLSPDATFHVAHRTRP